ncbi:hypothetical protein [Actinoplanes sp. NPDC051494]|uniref:hypothetical protein n=1 Tax=Actinoplanes sp. NPDC051494 TaxID=3363907 RepID=UPI003792F882
MWSTLVRVRSGAVALAVMVALLAALFGAAGAARLGWVFAPSLPSGEQAAELERVVFPGLTVGGGGAAPLWVPSTDGAYAEYGSAEYVAEHTGGALEAGALEAEAFGAGVRQRLTAAGWRIYDEVDPSSGRPASFRAARDGLVLSSNGWASFTVVRATPPWLWAFALAGAVLGALAGWLVTAWASRRARAGTLAAQVAGAVAWPATVVMLVLLLGRLLFRPALQSWGDFLSVHLLYVAGGPPRWVGLLAVVVLAVVAVLGRPTRTTGPAAVG